MIATSVAGSESGREELVKETAHTSLHSLSWLMVLMGLASCLLVASDIRGRQWQPMAVMRLLSPINALWA